MKVNEAISKYRKYIAVTRSKGTLKYFDGKVGIISRYLGHMDCDEIDTEILLQFIIDQRERNPEISNRTVNKYVMIIRRIIKYVTKTEIPFDKIPETNKLVEIIPDSDVERVFNYYKNNQTNVILIRNYLITRLFYETGLRLTEMLNLRLSDFDVHTNTIHVRKTKTNNERYVFFSGETRALLSKYILASKLDFYLFVDFLTGDQLKPYSINSIYKRLRKKLSIDKPINPHKWRHTFATKFTEKNGNMEVLRQIMGHTTLDTTQKYLHVGKEHLRQEYIRLYGN